MKKRVILIIAILLSHITKTSHDAENLELISRNLINLAYKYDELRPAILEEAKRKAKEEMAKIDKKFYKKLNKALSKPTFNEIQQALGSITERPTITDLAQSIINMLIGQGIGIKDNILQLKYKQLEFSIDKFVFTNVLLLICKVTEAIMSQHETTDTISIFSDQLFSSPFLVFLLIFSLHHMGYLSLIFNLLSAQKINFEALEELIKTDLSPLNCKINQYSNLKELIDSKETIDIYLTNITNSNPGMLCQGKDQEIFIEHSELETVNYIIATKNLHNHRTRDEGFSNLVTQLSNNEPNNRCKIYKSSHVGIADVIYSTYKTKSKSIPLFAARFVPQDTGSGKVMSIKIIDAKLTFNNYPELLSSIFKTILGVKTKDFTEKAELFDLYMENSDKKSFTLLNGNLNDTPSIIKTFIRREKIMAPSEITVD